VNVTTEQPAVWRNASDWERDKEPVAVCTSVAAAWAVFRLLNPPWQTDGIRRWKKGAPPVVGTLHQYLTRPDLAEDAHRKDAYKAKPYQGDWKKDEAERLDNEQWSAIHKSGGEL
jgi:hypothetical protein